MSRVVAVENFLAFFVDEVVDSNNLVANRSVLVLEARVQNGRLESGVFVGLSVDKKRYGLSRLDCLGDAVNC